MIVHKNEKQIRVWVVQWLMAVGWWDGADGELGR